MMGIGVRAGGVAGSGRFHREGVGATGRENLTGENSSAESEALLVWLVREDESA